MAPLAKLVWLALLAVSSTDAINIRMGERKTPGQLMHENEARQAASQLSRREDTDPSLLYPAHHLSVPVDHFHNETTYEPHSDSTFPLRYWFDATHYQPGGPVIILQSGETSGEGRLPFLQKGIVAQLAQATHGIGVVLEHRYYGTSWPVNNLTTENLRFLTTEQAMADEAYFVQHVKYPGLEHYGDLSSNTTAYISYGGSYAGAFSAFLRVQYPDLFWGSIGSSAVTEAIYDYWAYYEPIAEYAPQACITTQKTIINIVDNILIGKNDSKLTSQLKTAFGLPNVTHDDDFASVLSSQPAYWQSLVWDPAVSSDQIFYYCDNITSNEILYPHGNTSRSTVEDLIEAGGYKANDSLVNNMLNMIGFLNMTVVSECGKHKTQDQCHGTHNSTTYQLSSIEDASWKSWPYQYCTEWGYLQTGNVPEGELPLISRMLDLEYESLICREAFNITTPPELERVNKFGGYDISYPRLAFIDGQWDPWEPATPHGLKYGAKPRTSTTSEPFFEIDCAVHHWDEYGLFPNETTPELPPQPVKDAQTLLREAVQEWMVEFNQRCTVDGGCSTSMKPDL